MTPGPQGLTSRWSLSGRGGHFVGAGHPEDALEDGKNGWKITHMAVSDGFARRGHRRPHEGRHWPRGHGLYYY